MDNDRPDLPTELQLKIESLQANVHKKYLEQLRGFLVQRTLISPIVPPAPRPIALCQMLGEYTGALFSIEAEQYPQEPRLRERLDELAKRISDRVLGMIGEIESRGLGSIYYHATKRDVVIAVFETLRLMTNRRLSSLKSSKLSKIPSKTQNRAFGELPTTHRLSSSIDCPAAARKLESFLKSNGIGLTQFAIKAMTTDRTLRNFRRTGKVRRDIFEGIARAMNMTKEELLRG